jgi:hypothetical protein
MSGERYPYVLPPKNPATRRRWILPARRLRQLLKCGGANRAFDPRNDGASSFACAADQSFAFYMTMRTWPLLGDPRCFDAITAHAHALARALLDLEKHRALLCTKTGDCFADPLPEVAAGLYELARAARADSKAILARRGRGRRVSGELRARRELLAQLFADYRHCFHAVAVDGRFVESVRIILGRAPAQRRAVREDIRRALRG